MRRVAKVLAGVCLAGALSVCPPVDSHARDSADTLAPAPVADLVSPMVDPTGTIADDSSEVSRLMAIEASIIGGLMSVLTAAFLLWIKADRKRTDRTMAEDRKAMTGAQRELVTTLKEQVTAQREADTANRAGLSEIRTELGRVRDAFTAEIRQVRADMDRGFDRLDTDIRELDKRVSEIESTATSAAATMTKGRRPKDV